MKETRTVNELSQELGLIDPSERVKLNRVEEFIVHKASGHRLGGLFAKFTNFTDNRQGGLYLKFIRTRLGRSLYLIHTNFFY